MSYETFVARRHLSRRMKSGFVSLISMISVGGVGVGVMALIVVIGVMSGFDRELKRKIVNVQPHLRIERVGGVEDPEHVLKWIRDKRIPGLKTAASFVEGQAMIRSQTAALGVMVKGIDFEREDLSIYREHMLRGELAFEDTVKSSTARRLFFFKKKSETKYHSVFIGENLARILGVGVGDEVSLIVPFDDGSGAMSLARVKNEKFAVGGIFRLGMNDFDTGLVILGLPSAQKLYRLGEKVTGISLRLADVDQAQPWKYQLRGDFDRSFILRSWYDMNENFFQALQVEKSVMTILLALIVLVAAFNIIATLTMVVMEKTKDIGILRAVGATRGGIRRIFLIEGFSIGFLGVV
ncbi:MAG: hypothetical protein A2Z83_01510, partial [Omnitrophica bacterium GWA2_52_8]